MKKCMLIAGIVVSICGIFCIPSMFVATPDVIQQQVERDGKTVVLEWDQISWSPRIVE